MSITEAVEQSLENSIERERWARGRGDISDILARGRALPDIDPRTAEEIVGFDEHGAPA